MSDPRHPHVELALRSIKHYLEKGRVAPCPENISMELREKTGAFVSIKKNGQLRGCVGTITPTEPDLASEIIRNAVHAAVKDPRFAPVTLDELPGLTLSVDVLTPPEKISDASQLDPKRYGLIVKKNGKQGVLLPDIEGVDSVKEQIRICKRKAGLPEDEPVEFYRFQVRRYR